MLGLTKNSTKLQSSFSVSEILWFSTNSNRGVKYCELNCFIYLIWAFPSVPNHLIFTNIFISSAGYIWLVCFKPRYIRFLHRICIPIWFDYNAKQAGAELGQAQLKLELELSFTWFKFCCSTNLFLIFEVFSLKIFLNYS